MQSAILQPQCCNLQCAMLQCNLQSDLQPAICDLRQQSVTCDPAILQTCNLQSAILQSVFCNLYSVICNLQSATGHLQSYNPRSVICDLNPAICNPASFLLKSTRNVSGGVMIPMA
jgi:hypothetical protein